MDDPPRSPTGVDGSSVSMNATVVASNEQHEIVVDLDRWSRLAEHTLDDLDLVGELTLTFVDRDEMADLNLAHMGVTGPTDVLSFPLDAADDADDSDRSVEAPRLLGDVVVCPAVAADAAPAHAGTVDDELALLVVHGILHVAGFDHAEPVDTNVMRGHELDLLSRHHWNGPPPTGFQHEQAAT